MKDTDGETVRGSGGQHEEGQKEAMAVDRPQEGDRELNMSPPPAMCLPTGSPHRHSALPWGPQQETGSE